MLSSSTRQFRKTPIAAAAAIAALGAFALDAQTASTTIEAESMTLSSYVKENWRIATSTSRSTGTATKKFSGTSGTYDIDVFVVPEPDGQPTVEVYKGSTMLRAFKYPLGNSPTSFKISSVKINSGETLKVVGRPAPGTRARVDKLVLTAVASSTPTSPTPTSPTPVSSYSYSGTPYTGSPIAVPKAVPAVNFDKGGQGVAYKDLTAGNAGNIYRTSEDVDLTTASDTNGNGYAVRDFRTGEWLAYTLNVPANGAYDLAVKASSGQSSPATFHIEIDGKDVSGPISVPNTGGWNTYKWFGKSGVNLAAGKRILKLVSDAQYFNAVAMSVLVSSTSSPTTPTTSTPSYGVYFKTPAANARVSGQLGSGACEVAGTGVKSVQFSIDSSALNTDSAAPWQCSLDTTKLTDGTHALKAVATYTDGTQGTAQVNVNVDNGSVADGGTVVSKPANLLFWSEYESAGMSSPTDCYKNGCWQQLTGTETRTGFSWPPKVSGSDGRFQMLLEGPSISPSTITNYMSNQLRSTTGRKGTSTRALYSVIEKNADGNTSPSVVGVNTQVPYILFPNSDVPELYISYWAKLQGDLADKMKAGTWRVLSEWKTSDTDRRFTLNVNSYGGAPYWSVKLDQRIDPKVKIWEVNNKSVPVPLDKWFKVEIYWKRSAGSDGRVWTAINGQVLVDKRGANLGPNKSPINRIFISQLYHGHAYPSYQWMDDLQIWSTFPAARAGDPWYDAPYAPR